MSRVQKLFFRMDLIDRLTQPANRAFGKLHRLVDKTKTKISGMAQSAQNGFRNIAFGALGLVGAGHAIAGAMAPALEMNRAMGEVASLGVHESELNNLKNTAMNFAEQYGESASEFVSASYDIQSAIGGLANGELAAFTKASGVLAVATKSDASVITDYVGTMYGIFQTQADAMGKAAWVNKLAGQTASAVQMFKTTGSEMAGAFSSLGAGANTAGIAMTEQMAVLGTLQATMSGSEAGTKYRAFLKGVGKAQDKLGMQFTDSAGRMLPMVQILEKLKGKFGAMDKTADSVALQEAFGSSQAVGLIQLLSSKVGGLNSSIAELGNQKGMEKAEEMARAIVDPWDQFAASVRNLRIAMGDLLLPVLNPLIEKMSGGIQTLRKWSVMFPNLSKAVGALALVVLGFVGVMALLSLGAGIAQVAWGGMMIMWAAMTPLIWLKNAALVALSTSWFLVNVVAAAFPGFWLVAALVAVVAGIYLLVKYWDDLKAALGEQEWFKAIVSMVDTVSNKLTELGNSKWFEGLTKAFVFVKNQFMDLVKFIAENNPIQLVADGIGTLVDKLGLGEDISIDETKKSVRESVSNVSVAGMGGGGIQQDIANISNKGNHIENMTVVSPSAVNGASLKDEFEMI